MLTTSPLGSECLLCSLRSELRLAGLAPKQSPSWRQHRSFLSTNRENRQIIRSRIFKRAPLSVPLRQRVEADAKGRQGSRGSYRPEFVKKLNPSRPPQDLKREVVDETLWTVEDELKNSPLLTGLGLDSISYKRPFFAYRQAVLDELHDEESRRRTSSQIQAHGNVVYSKKTLQHIFQKNGRKGLQSALRYGFYGYIVSSKFSKSDLSHQGELADLRYPSEWFPATRAKHRTVHLHVGPTNSGKTYHALKRLEEAASGVYAGPLRLLAHEVYTRMNAKGKRCLLVTGEERRSPDDYMSASLSSCTVEMVPCDISMDVAVIDEIQMINNPERGWAWTEAYLGLKAKELHICGEERTIPLIQELAASVGDKLEIHRYERLSPLKVAEESLGGDLKKLEKGDCVVSFSVIGIHALRREIEKSTGRKVAIVYGSLPPETRAQQAKLFNDPNNDYDFLVASDAIGMGLNLSIKRVIFETTSKRMGAGRSRVPLPVAEIKQIAGRAGRYSTAAQDIQKVQPDDELVSVKGDINPSEENSEAVSDHGSLTPSAPTPRISRNVGYVTTLEPFDYPYLKTCMENDPTPITTAGLLPPPAIIERFTSYFPPGTPFSYILLRLHEIAKLNSRFHLCQLRDQLSVADTIQPVQGLTTMDRIIFCASPASAKPGDDSEMKLIKELATCVEQQQGGNLLELKELDLDVLDKEPQAEREYLVRLEKLHKGIILYLWLGYRFAGVFNTQPLALHTKGLVEEAIEKTLAMLSLNEKKRQQLRAQREKQMLKQLNEQLSQHPRPDSRAEESSVGILDEQDDLYDASKAQGTHNNRLAAPEDTEGSGSEFDDLGAFEESLKSPEVSQERQYRDGFEHDPLDLEEAAVNTGTREHTVAADDAAPQIGLHDSEIDEVELDEALEEASEVSELGTGSNPYKNEGGLLNKDTEIKPTAPVDVLHDSQTPLQDARDHAQSGS
ncbi:MAG: RNA helicase [Bogoriella megaspora]|nr:MAG: RNA helicase [Bogoriella megaspora]